MTVPSRQGFRTATTGSQLGEIQRFTLRLANRQRACRVDLRLLRRVAGTLLTERLPVQGCDLGVHLVAALEMTRLNETFVHHAGPTDVITFDYLPPASRQAPRPFQLHADIFICVDEALVQARRFRTAWQSEVVRYLIHGLLHLLGYDDRTRANRGKMKRAEDRLLREMAARFPLSQFRRKPRIRP